MNKIEPIIKEIKEFIKTTKGKIIVLSSVSVIILVIIIGVVVGVSGKNSSGSGGGGFVPNGKYKWYVIKPQTKTTPWSNLTPAKKPIPIPSKGKINLNSMSIFTSKRTYWDTGTQWFFVPKYYKYSLRNNLTSKKTNNILLSTGILSYAEGATTHGYANITEKTNFQYSKNNNILFNNLSVYSIIGWSPLFGPQFSCTTTLKPIELKNINNKISTIINPLLSKVKQSQKLIITGINYYYNFTILSDGNEITDRVQGNILININSLDYSIINK